MQGIKKSIRALSGAAILAITVASGGLTHAAPIKFTLHDGGYSGSWIVEDDQAPTKTVYGSDAFDLKFSNGTGHFSDAWNIQFFSNDYPYNFLGMTHSFYYWKPNDSGNYAYSTPLFSGNVSAPHFIYGTYSLKQASYCCYAYAGTENPTLTIGPAAPAPIVGGGALAALAAFAGLFLTRRISITRRLLTNRKFGFA